MINTNKELGKKFEPIGREYLLERGFCCGNKCLNCPYYPKYEKNNKNINLNNK